MKNRNKKTIEDPRPEYDFDYSKAVCGKYCKRLIDERSNVVILDPDLAEALFWTPAALLPDQGVVWEKVNENTARVTVSRAGLSQEVNVTVDGEGRPIEVSFMRWSNANPEKIYRLQPFGGTLSDFREVQGFRLPFHVEAGNMYGTDDNFVFSRQRSFPSGFRRPSHEREGQRYIL